MRCNRSQITARALRLFGRQMRRNVKGVAAVEFAMIVPIMFMLLVGALEFGNAITVDRRVSQISSSVSDLVSRADKTTTAELDFITQKIAASIMSPLDATPLKISIISVKADIANASNTTVDWAYAHNGGTAYSPGSSYTVPTGLMTPGSSVIVGEVKYDYTPFIFNPSATETVTGKAITPGAYTMEEKFYLSPRTKSCVSYNNINCVTGNPF